MKIALFIGKFSPIHKDHVKSILGIKDWADENGARVKVYSTISTDKSKQPLSFDRKMFFVKQALEGKDIEVVTEPTTKIWDVIEKELWEQYKSTSSDKGLYLFTGSDHLIEYEGLLKSIMKRYEAKNREINFDVKVMPTEGRVDGVGISATELRLAAKTGDYETFKKYSPLDDDKTRVMFNSYRDELKESLRETQFNIEDTEVKNKIDEVVEKLRSSFPEAKVYFIGGTARDLAVNKAFNDIDIATNLTKNQIMSVFPDVVSANRFGAGYIVIIDYKGQKFDLDSVVDHDILDKIKTGDLTFNCMAIDAYTGEIFDPENGLEDWKSKTLRFSQYVFDELKRGAEARSVLRPFKFQSRYGWEFDWETTEAIEEWVANHKAQEKKYSFNRNSPHNMQKIWDAIRKGPHADMTIQNLKELGLYDVLIKYRDKKNEENRAKSKDTRSILLNFDDVDDGMCRNCEETLAVEGESLCNDCFELKSKKRLGEDSEVRAFLRRHDPEYNPDNWKNFRDRSQDHLSKDVLNKGFNRPGMGGYFEHECNEIIKRIKKGELDRDEMEGDEFVMDSMRRYGRTEKGNDNKINVNRSLFQRILGESLKEKSMGDTNKAWESTMKMLHKIKEIGNKGYIVGGAVRDHLMGKDITEADDFDIMTDMSKGWIGQKLGTITGSAWRNGDEVLFVDVDGEIFDIKRIGRNRDFIAELEMRDLTMNAIAWDPIDDEYVDPTGGKEDIKNKIIAFTPKNEELARNGQQPARVLRFIRFYSTTGFSASESSLDALFEFAKKVKGNFGIESENNFENNWNKLIKGKNADIAIELMKELGLYKYCEEKFPSVIAGKGSTRRNT